MILLAVPLVAALGIAVVYSYLRKQPDTRSLYRTTIRTGIGVGVARAGLASLGWYVVERTSGEFQGPAYILSILALPEAAVLGPTGVGPAPFSFYMCLSLLLLLGTTVSVGVVAVVVEMSRARR